MKRVLCFIILAFLLAAGFPASGPGEVQAASAAPTITVETVSAHPGEEISVSITISNNPGICAALISVTYGEGLELVDVTDPGLLPNPVHGGDLQANPYLLSWDNSLADADTTQNGTLVILHFRVLENATEDNCSVTAHYEPDNVFNLALENVHFETLEGGIQLMENAPIQDTPTQQSEEGSPIVWILCITAALALAAGIVIVLKRKKSTATKGGETR